MLLKTYLGALVNVTVDDSRDTLVTPFGKTTLKDRYLLPGETIQGCFARVAAYYSDDEAMAQRMYDYISLHWFMPATPVLSNGGTDRGHPISCFLTNVDDSLDGIGDTQLENLWLAAKGGGIGTYWGNVRSIDEKVGEVGSTSGVIPFIKMQDSQTLGVSQGSLRRGSAAVYLDISHPEIEEFLEIRKPTGADVNRKCLNIHHGVNVSDAFMEAVTAGGDFDLVSPKTGEVRKTVDARALWMKMLTMRLETGEPYIIFSDTVNRNRPECYVKHGLRVVQSNLCSEIALTTGLDHHKRQRSAVCCLGSVNVVTQGQWFGDEQFIRDCLVFLDNVMTSFIDNTDGSKGFENARYSAMRERSIGLGWMGFVSYLQDKGIPVESTLAHYENKRIWTWLRAVGEKANVMVAEERGACPDYEELGIMKRWAHMFSIAPTASISYICGQVSPCHDPLTGNTYTAKTLSGSHPLRNLALERRLVWYADIIFGQFQGDASGQAEAKLAWTEEVWDAIKTAEGSVQGLDFLTDHDKLVFKIWEEIDQVWLVQHMAARATDDCGPDQMASNNLFMRPDCDVRDLHGLHKKAWETGVPSLYYLRSVSLARVQAEHVAGEMPAATPKHEVVLRDRGEYAQRALADEADKYEACLVCQ